MSYPLKTKEKAIRLRNKGYSIKEISEIIHVSKNTSSLWNRGIALNTAALQRLLKRKILGQYKSIETKRKKKEIATESVRRKALAELEKTNLTIENSKLLCSIFFWTEGGKHTDSYVYFTNSDPKMVSVFITLMRFSFAVDEKKFRALVHIHEYHNDMQMKRFWSDVTKIPISQFSKSYLKQNTKKRKRESYPGCIRIRYYDSKIASELRTIYNTFAEYLSLKTSSN